MDLEQNYHFAVLCGVEFDSSTDQKESHFNKADAILKDGATVDCKEPYNLSKG